MKIGIIQFPGSNCERETKLAVKRAGMEPVEFLWNQPQSMLAQFAGYVIVGGFSYEDRSRAGIIAALDPVMQTIKAEAEKGKPVLGICNGAQILVEAGLVPGLENHKVGMVLTDNKRIAHSKVLGTGFYNAWVNMRLADQYQRNAFTSHLSPKDILSIPVAHGEGRFVMSEALLKEVEKQGLAVFQYCDERGEVSEHFPVNPNGSMRNIAAVANKNGNVMAMMPHPERTQQGDVIFQSMRDYIAEGRAPQTQALSYYPRRDKFASYQCPATAHECLVELIITDNQALTVQNTLQLMGLPVKVSRRVHWEIHGDADVVELIKKSGMLYNPRKENTVMPAKAGIQGNANWMPASAGMTNPSAGMTVSGPQSQTITLLIRPKDDIIGRQKSQTLRDYFTVDHTSAVRHSVLWQFSADGIDKADLEDRIIHSHIIHNPYAHDCYYY